MGYEIDFLNVGDGEKSGDAICLRFGDLYGTRDNQFVMVVDGGTAESGAQLVEHIKRYYFTDTVDLVVSTHPDNDHIAGLCPVVEQLQVGRLWMHLPWEHADEFRSLFKSRTLTSIGLKRSIRKALDTAVNLEELARRKRIPIDEPFADLALPFADLGITVLGPTTEYYTELLPQFRETPEALHAVAQPGMFQRAGAALLEVARRVAEGWGIETLTDPPENATSAENNSSVILTIQRDGRLLLLTGDAGVPALDRAANAAEFFGIDLPSSNFVQMPHHGSRRNVGPKVLDRVLGPPGQAPNKTAFVSCSRNSPKHPARKVCNAFQRRGAKDAVHATQGSPRQHHHEAPDRGWSASVPLPFYDEVEE